MDYTAPDKSTTAPNNQWTANEHNEMKAAINSKMDSANIVQTLSGATANSVLSTQAMLTIYGAGNSLIYQGQHNGMGDIRSAPYNKSGFWMPTTSFPSPAHASYPVDHPGMLRVSKDANFTTIEYITFENIPRSYISVQRPSADPSPWVQLVSVDYLNANGYTPLMIGGTPTFDTSSSGGLTYTVNGDGSSDSSGSVTVIKSGDPIPNDEIATVRVTFGSNGFPPGVLITPLEGVTCDLYISSRTDQGFSVGATNFKEAVNTFGFSYYVPPVLPS